MPPSEHARHERQRKNSPLTKCTRAIGASKLVTRKAIPGEGNGGGLRKREERRRQKGDEHSILSSLEKVEPNKESTERVD